MTARHLFTSLAVSLVTLLAQPAEAQFEDAFNGPSGDFDAQMFAPVNFDYGSLPIRKDSGFFFRYDKLGWVFTGERHTVGQTTGDNSTTNPHRTFNTGRNGPNQGGPSEGELITIPVPTTFSGINSAAPRATLGWGERYELGYFSGDATWTVGVLDGPETLNSETYGFGGTGSVLGSVRVNFNVTDPNLRLGFLDFEDQNGNVVVGGDNIGDDMDEDAHHAANYHDVEDPAGVPDTRFYFYPDFDDLVALPIAFETLTVSNRSEIDGIEIMRSHRLGNRHKMQKHQNREIEIGYGVRFVRLKDDFNVLGTGGILGNSFWNTQIINNLVGPQLSAKWAAQRGRFRLSASGRCLLGYNIANFEQTAGIGQRLVPGQLNSFLYLDPTVSHHGKRENDFSPTVEIRAEATYQVTGALAARLGYTGTFIDNISRAAPHVDYTLPNLGFRDGVGTQEIFINGVNAGFEAVY